MACVVRALLLLALAAGGAGCRKSGGKPRNVTDAGSASRHGADGRVGTAAPAEALGDRARASADEPQMRLLPPCPLPNSETPGPSEGLLRIHLAADPPSLDPLDESSELATRVLWGLVHEPLLRCGGRSADRGVVNAPTPGLATRWQLSPAGDMITLHLRPDAVFHDGRPVASGDVRATLETVWHGGARMPQARAALADLAAIDLLSPESLRLRLKRPSPLTLRALCEIPIVPATWLRARRTGGPTRDPVGSGPYRFAAWLKGKSLRLLRFARPGLPAAALAEIVFVVEPDTGKALGQLRRGGLDVIPQIDGVHFPDQVRPAALGAGTLLLGLPAERYTFLAINHQRPPLGLPAFRQGLSLSWDRAGLAEEIHRGLVTPIAAPPFADLPAPNFDPTEAARLLREAAPPPPPSAPGRGRGRATPIQFRLTLLHSNGRIARAELRRLAERLRRSGVLLELLGLDAAALVERLRAGQFDLALLSWKGRPSEDPRPRFAGQGSFNFGGHRSQRLEALLDELRVSDSPTARAELDRRLGAVLAEELPGIFLYRHTELALAAKRVHGLCNDGGRLDVSAASLVP